MVLDGSPPAVPPMAWLTRRYMGLSTYGLACPAGTASAVAKWLTRSSSRKRSMVVAFHSMAHTWKALVKAVPPRLFSDWRMLDQPQVLPMGRQTLARTLLV